MNKIVLTFLLLPSAWALAQPAETYPVLSQGDGLICGASLKLNGVGAEQVTSEAIRSSHPVTNLAFDPKGTSAIRADATGMNAAVPRYVYRGDWVDGEGKSHHVLCSYVVNLMMARPILEASSIIQPDK